MTRRLNYIRMVSWENIASVTSNNQFRDFHVRDIDLPIAPAIDRFPICGNRVEPVVKHVEQNAESLPPLVKPVEKNAESLQCFAKEIDPIAIDLADKVELYDNSSRNTKKQMECEEALRIEGLLAELYKSQSGRSRGWTKVGLEALIQPRCASGGDIKELDKSKKAFAWPLVADDKVYSSFLDFVCLAKNIKVAVWFEEEKHVILFPASDKTPEPLDKATLYNVTNKGRVLRNGLQNGSELLKYCDLKQWILMPPNSVLHTLSTLSLTELDSVAKKLGIVANGSKKERVAQLAVFKLRQRLQKVETTLTQNS